MASTAQPTLVLQQPAEVFVPLRNTATIPAVTITNPDLVVAQIVWESPLPPAVPFSLDQPTYDFTDLPESWQLAVRSVNARGDVSRYVLIPSQTGEILFPRYAGETLAAGSIVEIWTVPGQASAVVADDIVLVLNTFTRPSTFTVINNSATNTPDNTNLTSTL